MPDLPEPDAGPKDDDAVEASVDPQAPIDIEFPLEPGDPDGQPT